jgi:hypothetical protein
MAITATPNEMAMPRPPSGKRFPNPPTVTLAHPRKTRQNVPTLGDVSFHGFILAIRPPLPSVFVSMLMVKSGIETGNREDGKGKTCLNTQSSGR